MVGLAIPERRFEGLGMGIMVQSQPKPSGMSPRTDRIFQVISDPRLGAVLSVSIDEAHGLVEVWYMRAKDGTFMLGTFRETDLRAAIRHDAIDWNGVENLCFHLLLV